MNGEAGPKAGLDTLQDHGSRSADRAASVEGSSAPGGVERQAAAPRPRGSLAPGGERSLRRQLARLDHRIGHARQTFRDVAARLRELEAERAAIQDDLNDDLDAL